MASPMSNFSPPPARAHVQGTVTAAALVLDHVVAEHASEAATLREQRARQVRAPVGGLDTLDRLDARIEAHLDGLEVAGAAGSLACRTSLDEAADGGAGGAAFACGVLALRNHDAEGLAELIALCATRADVRRGLSSAFGWVSAQTLQGVVRSTLASPLPQAKAVALAACRMHRVDPGPALVAALGDADPVLRAQALRAAGELGRVDLLAPVLGALGDAHPAVAQWAARSACRLGDRHRAPQALLATAQQEDAEASGALAWLMAAAADDQAQDIARQISATAQARPSAAAARRVVQAIALLGDTRFVPWLLDRLEEPALARLAGEALGWITGVDLAESLLERLDAPPPTDVNEAEDAGVELDPDEGLPWPDASAVRDWWARAPLGPTPHAPRLFRGRTLTAGAAISALATAPPRQRAHAALLLALQHPGSVMFPVAAPAWRQRRWLAAN